MKGRRLNLSDDHVRALLDAVAYYKMSDYGHGEMRPLDAEQEEHRRLIDQCEKRLERKVGWG